MNVAPNTGRRRRILITFRNVVLFTFFFPAVETGSQCLRHFLVGSGCEWGYLCWYICTTINLLVNGCYRCYWWGRVGLPSGAFYMRIHLTLKHLVWWLVYNTLHCHHLHHHHRQYNKPLQGTENNNPLKPFNTTGDLVRAVLTVNKLAILFKWSN